MIEVFATAATLATALACALVAGVFFAFSVAVMKALGRLPTAAGMAAMQQINVVIVNPTFLAVFLGAAAGSAIEVVAALARWSAPGAACRLAGGLLYLIGSLLVTIACNVPRNEALAQLSPGAAAGEQAWSDYLKTWTAWNHVRTAASLASAALLLLALLR